MLSFLNLRWKILLALIGLSILPLIASLLIVYRLSERQLEADLDLRLTSVATLVERSTTSAQREKANYIQLLAANKEIGSALRYAALLGPTRQLAEQFAQAHRLFNFDLVVVLDPEGEPIMHLPEDTPRPRTSGAEHPAIQASLVGVPFEMLELFDEHLSIVATSPVLFEGELVGHLVGVTFIDRHFLTETFGGHLEALSGAELAFFNRQGVISATGDGLANLSMTAVLDGRLRQTTIAGTPYALFQKRLTVAEHGMLLALDRSGVVDARRQFGQILLLLLATVATVAVLVGLAISRSIVLPLARIGANLQEIADGEGDLTQELPVRQQDEIGALASGFNRFLGRMRETVRNIRTVSLDLTGASERIRSTSREVNQGAVRQSQSLEESHQALQGIEESVAGIAESTGALLDSTESSSSATLELGATIEEIASQMEKLFGIVDEVTSSITEMSVTSQQISDNIETLSSSTETTASSIIEMDASTKEIEENAERTSRLSEEAAQDALKGKEAVEETISGIVAIRESVDQASQVIQELGNQSKSIGRILTVIDEVADQTSLLALNAAIIAAQAGEQGKGFAVVADEIRQLATRTAVSTREITTIIASLQNGTQEAVAAMTAGSERVHQEVARSRTAGAALEKIRSSTVKSTEQVRSIVRATQEQSKGSRQITTAIHQITTMLGQIAAAVRQQTTGATQLAKAAEVMRDIAAQGKVSTGEQANGSRQINLSMDQIRTMIERIDEATRALSQRSREVVLAVAEIRRVAEANASRTAELDQVVELISGRTDSLQSEVGAYKA
ncbi:MAG: HAMP domain-containing protein [Desulfuromonadales bacterium]|nr:HAMP domain-containing protein [Desulfuromonadales bacterium]